MFLKQSIRKREYQNGGCPKIIFSHFKFLLKGNFYDNGYLRLVKKFFSVEFLTPERSMKSYHINL